MSGHQRRRTHVIGHSKTCCTHSRRVCSASAHCASRPAILLDTDCVTAAAQAGTGCGAWRLPVAHGEPRPAVEAP